MKKTTYIAAAVAIAAGVLTLGGVAYAQTVQDTAEVRLQQIINAGAMRTDITDADGEAVTGTPIVGLDTTDVDTAEQTTTGTYGDNTTPASPRVFVSNPGVATAGWTLSVAATDGPTALWVDGANNFDYNDPAVNGNGQLTIDPATGTITPFGAGTTTDITLGTETAFSDVVNSITLVTAGAGSESVWEGTVHGMGVSQRIPGGQAPGTYTIDLTQTLTSQ